MDEVKVHFYNEVNNTFLFSKDLPLTLVPTIGERVRVCDQEDVVNYEVRTLTHVYAEDEYTNPKDPEIAIQLLVI